MNQKEKDRQKTESMKLRLILKAFEQTDDFKNGVRLIPVSGDLGTGKYSDYTLRVFLKKGALGANVKEIQKARTQEDPEVDLSFRIDFMKSANEIASGMKLFVEDIQRSRRKRKLACWQKKKQSGKRMRLHSYYLQDIDIYNELKPFERKSGSIPYYKIARKQLKEKGQTDIIFSDVQKKGKELRAAYEKAKWLIEEKGYRDLM